MFGLGKNKKQIKIVPYKGKDFKIRSYGDYAEVTYKDVKGYVGMNLHPQYYYGWQYGYFVEGVKNPPCIYDGKIHSGVASECIDTATYQLFDALVSRVEHLRQKGVLEKAEKKVRLTATKEFQNFLSVLPGELYDDE